MWQVISVSYLSKVEVKKRRSVRGWMTVEEAERKADVTLWQVWGHVGHVLGVDVCPVKVVIGILLVITLGEALVKRTASCKEKTHSDLVYQQILAGFNKCFFFMRHIFLPDLIV